VYLLGQIFSVRVARQTRNEEAQQLRPGLADEPCQPLLFRRRYAHDPLLRREAGWEPGCTFTGRRGREGNLSPQSVRTNVTFIRTRYSEIWSFSSMTSWLAIQAAETFFRVLVARFRPFWMASSKLVVELEVISLMRATVMGTPYICER